MAGSLTLRALRAALGGLDALARRSQQSEARLRRELILATRFRPRADDIHLVGFPRSGLSLLQMALYQLTTDGEMSFPHVAAVSPTLELEVALGGMAQLERLPAPRLLKSFSTYERLPRPGRVVYLARDVGDVAVSAFHFCSLLAGRELDLDDFLRQFVAGHPLLGGTWFDHLRSWWPHRDDPDVLFLDYDAALADLGGMLRSVAAFCRLEVDDEVLRRAEERCRFDSVRLYEARFDPRRRQITAHAASFIRKGEAGGGKSAIAARHREELARRAAELGRRLGCEPGDPLAKVFDLA